MTYLLHQKVSRISIVENTSGLNRAVFNAETESNFMTAEELLCKVKIAYAGRIVEELEFESATTRAMNDITQATQYLLAYVGQYGFCRTVWVIEFKSIARIQISTSRASNKDINSVVY